MHLLPGSTTCTFERPWALEPYFGDASIVGNRVSSFRMHLETCVQSVQTTCGEKVLVHCGASRAERQRAIRASSQEHGYEL